MGCYFCGGEVSGVEHIPPKSFFPKGKRENLITVESCDIHNQNKSKDDEYVRTIFLSSMKTKGKGKEHLEDLAQNNRRTLKRVIERIVNTIPKEKDKLSIIIETIENHDDTPIGHAKAIEELNSKNILNLGLISLLNKEVREESFIDDSGNKIDTTSFVYDEKRLNFFIEGVARGLYFHTLGSHWDGKVNILPHTFLKEDALQRDKDLSEDFKKDFDLSKAKGEQKEYFCYEGCNRFDEKSGEFKYVFFNILIFDTFFFTAIFLPIVNEC